MFKHIGSIIQNYRDQFWIFRHKLGKILAPMPKTEFIHKLLQVINANYNNNLEYFDIFENSKKRNIINFGNPHNKKDILNKLFGTLAVKSIIETDEINKIKKLAYDFQLTYDTLSDELSKDILLKLVAYNLLGPGKVYMPGFENMDEYIEELKELDPLILPSFEALDTGFRNLKLRKMNLDKIGVPIILYINPCGVHTIFISKQYEYNYAQCSVRADKGDVVIDAGGCWGDTALYFAHLVGAAGKVYSFEFIPSNLRFLELNINENVTLKNNIEVVKRPLWSESGIKMSYNIDGPASKVINSNNQGDNVETLSIDDFVRNNKLKKVDFIKMDIEGAEQNAIRGGVKTIKTFSPKLAVSIYHNFSDMAKILPLIKGINPNYKFYLGHHTPGQIETVLYAAPVKEKDN